MAGTLKPNSVIVWTRASSTAKVSVLYGTNPTLSGAVETKPVLVTSASDFIFKTTLSGLSPGTRYYYATRIANPSKPTSYVLGPIGRFRTAPLSTQNLPVSFLFGADTRVTHMSEYGTFDAMRTHEADFFISLGDMPYADGAITAADFRNKHKAVRNSPKWWSFIQRFPVEATVDDHEVTNNWNGATSKTLVATGVAVFKEYYPFPPGMQQIYRSIPWGKGLEIFMLDARSYRSVNGIPTLPTKTMLGTAQKQWLLQALKNSTAIFKIVATSVPLRHGSASDTWSGNILERQEIFRFINEQKIRNVVFISGDNHIAAVHHHREGFREYMACPIAQFIGKGVAADPEMRWRSRQLNYGLIRVDPLASPPTLTAEIHSPSGLLKREIMQAAQPATLGFVGDEAQGGFRMQGPFFYRNRGRRVSLGQVEPGPYLISFDQKPELLSQPAELKLSIPNGSAIAMAANWRDVQTQKVLFADSFEKLLIGYTVIDETTNSGPSSWFTDQGYLVQASNINGTGTLSRPGTILWTGSKAWQDYTMSVRARPRDNDAFGILFRFQDSNNYYRFSLDSQRTYRRLVRNVNGTFKVLAEDSIPYDPHNWYDIKAVAVGNRLQIHVGPDKIFDVLDSSHPRGAVGFYTWANLLTFFEDVGITQGDTAGAQPALAIARDEFNDGRITGWTIEDHGKTSAPSAWSEGGGILRQTSNIHDPTTAATKVSKPGTVAVLQTSPLGDFRYSARLMSGDNDAFGVVFRYVDANNNYRFFWDSERHQRRLTKVVGGSWSILYQDNTPYTPGQWYGLRCVAEGTRLRVYLDEELLVDVMDSSHKSGRVGLYCWANNNTSFDSVLVQAPTKERAVLVAITQNMVSKIHGFAPTSQLQFYGLALAFGRSPGIPLSILNPLDPRTLDLTPDFLFFESLRPSPIWSGLQGKLGASGELAAQINWPNFAELRGRTMYVGGWTGDVASRQIIEVLPTLEIKYP